MMKHVISFLWIMGFCSCGEQQAKQQAAEAAPVLDTGRKHAAAAHAAGITDGDMQAWEQAQDSLRKEILKRKEDKRLRESFFQEFYIRDVVTLSGDSIQVHIPFNLHGPDCGAPDCYSTDLSFSLKYTGLVAFPAQLPFREKEHGCVPEETEIEGIFRLQERNDSIVIYHSAEHKRTLVLFSPAEAKRSAAWYFAGPSAGGITVKSFFHSSREEESEEPDDSYPYTSWILTTNDYEVFLRRIKPAD